MKEEKFNKLREEVVELYYKGDRQFFAETFRPASQIFHRNDIELFSPGGSVQRKVDTILYSKHLNRCNEIVQDWSEKMNVEDWKELLKIVDKIEQASLARIQLKDDASDSGNLT
jgi:hypothetical protein